MGQSSSYHMTSSMFPVADLDVTKYQGLWYQIAKYPVLYEPNNTFDTTAEYTLSENGSILVKNKSYVLYDGSIRELSIQGYATPLAEGKGIFSVKFNPRDPRVANYWVMYLESDYSIAIVSQPSKQSLYILSRTPQIPYNKFQYILKYLQTYGFDLKPLILTPQTISQP